MKRRQFIKTTAAGAVIPSLGFRSSSATKTHILTFSFDDGFNKSFIKLAEIHEEYGLKACLNVIASGHFPDFEAVDDWILPELMGDFDTWNNLAFRGHEVMPHSWEHNNLAKLKPREAKKLISKCITYFNENLMRFDQKKAVFNFPFNSSTDELDQHALTLVRAVRTRGNAINPIPTKATRRVLGCTTNGPSNNDEWATSGMDTRKSDKRNLVKTLYLVPEELNEHNLMLKAKYDRMEKAEVRSVAYNIDTDYAALIVSYGTMSRVCRTAIDNMKNEGLSVGMIRPQTLFPFPEEQVLAAAEKASCKVVASIEMSMGQMIEDIQRSVQGKKPVQWYGKCGGDVPTPEEVMAFVHTLI